jgi:hypothetical protein
MSKQPEALRLADAIDRLGLGDDIAVELRRLHEVNAELVEALQAAVHWGAPFKDAPRDARPDWFSLANAALAKATGEQA